MPPAGDRDEELEASHEGQDVFSTDVETFDSIDDALLLMLAQHR